jgi:hypothetical protein
MQFFVRRILVVFFGDVGLSDRIGAAQSLNKGAGNLFSGEQTILPIPDDAPPEIPRIMLGDKGNMFRCHVSSKRVEFSLEPKKSENRKLAELQSDFLIHLNNIAKAVRIELKVRVERLGVVVNSVTFPEGSPVDFLISRFLKQGIVVDPREVNLNFLHRFVLGGFEVNRWQRFSCASSKDVSTSERAKGLYIETDVNTMPEMKYNFTVEQVPAFCSQAFTFIESDLGSLLAKES